MLGSLRKKLEEATAQINPFDGGKTASTVRAARQPVPPAQTVKQPQRSFVSKAFDQANIFDNNRTWKQEAPTNTKSGFQQFGQFGGQAARGAIGGTARLLNTAAAQVPQVDATARMVAANLTNNPTAFRNASRYAQEANQNFRRGQGGLLNTGTLYDAQDAARGDLKTGIKRIGGGAVESGLEIASAGVGGFAGKQLVQQGVKQGIQSQVPRLAANAALNTVQGGVTAYNQDAGLRDIAKNAALSGAVGTVADVGLGVGAAAVPKLTTKLAPTVSQATQGARNLTTNLVKPLADEGGFIQVGRTPKNIHPDDQAILTQFMDHARGITKLDPESAYRLELDAANIAERYGIDTPNTLGKFANAVDDRLMRERQAKRPSLLSDDRGSIQVPGNRAGKVKPRDFDKHISTNDRPIKVYRGEGKGIGNATLTNGRYYADSKEFASNFGKVSEGEIPAGSKVFDFDAIKSDPNQTVIPKEILSDPEATRQYLIKKGVTATKNTNTRGVEYVLLGEDTPGVELALKSKDYHDFSKRLLKDWDKYRDELSAASDNSFANQVTNRTNPREAIWEKAQKIKDARKYVDKHDKPNPPSNQQGSKPKRPSLFGDEAGAVGKNIRGFEADLEAAGLTSPKGSLDRGVSSPETPGQILERQSRQPGSKKSTGTSQSQSDSSLPVYNTKKVSNLDKAARSTQSIIRRQGKKGEELSGLLDQARDTKEIYLGQLQKQMPSVSKLARKGKNAIVNKDFENFVEAAQGKAKPKNELVAKAVKEWQATAPTIRQRAVDAGLDVGDLGPNYYPHIVDYDRLFKDKNMYNQSINHLVETGQAKTPEEAIQLLGHAKDISRNREFGNLEASRLIDLPFYDKTPNSFISYLTGSAKRTSQVETLGKGDEKALKLIADAGLEGYDTEAMKNAFDVAVGAKQYNPNASKVSGGIRKYVTTTRLGLGALTNISQNVNTGIVTGHMRTLGSAVKQLDPKTRQFVADTGVISDALLNDIKTQSGYSSFTSKVLGKGINKITAPFFGTVEKFNRSVAATAGRDYALRLAQKGNEKTLRKLGVTGEIKNKTLTEAQQIQAARKIVEKTQFKVDPQDLPGWADSPGGKLVAQFRTFSYNQGKFFSNEILKPAAKGNVLPLGRMLAALPVGYGLYETKRAIAGRPEEEDKKKVALATFQNIGGAGLVLDLYNSINPLGSKYLPSDRRQSMVTGAVAGPAAGVAIQGVGALSDVVQRKNAPKDDSTLEGKVVLGKNDESYTDATAISRFGLQQIPIAGTAIKNRVLPYKEQSDAEAGKSGKYTKDQEEVLNSLSGDKRATYEQALKEGRVSKAGKMTAAEDDYVAQAKNKADKLAAELPSGISKDSKDILTRYNRLSEDGKEKFNSDPRNEYKLELAKYERDKLDGKVTEVGRIKKDKELNKKKIALDYDPEVIELGSMNKGAVFDYINTSANGEELADRLLDYNDKLLEAGLISDHPYRDKYGNVDFDPDSSGGYKRGGKGSKGSKAGYDYTKDLFASDGSKTTKSLRAILEKAMAGRS